MSGTLYIVATPIGNLEDITLRALRILKEADGVVAEDTRRTLPLLTHYGIQKKLISYFEYSKQNKAEHILKLLEDGENLALVSDAGTPTLADPGARLISQAHQRGIPVVPVPGPSAMLAALSASGFPTDPFHFWGFLSPSGGKRRKAYALMASLDGSHCFYESPHKILKRLEEWKIAFKDYFIFVGREITKKFETIHVGSVEDVATTLLQEEPRGEYTVIISKERL